tara:strand:- start:114 stop:389 length:276 start_codon:yes stop_codon:yes gene_type:complete
MEYLVIDKCNDIFFFNNLKDVSEYLNLTKSQTNNELRQSIKHYNKRTNRGNYVQRMYDNPVLPPRLTFELDKYIYYLDDQGIKMYGEFVHL